MEKIEAINNHDAFLSKAKLRVIKVILQAGMLTILILVHKKKRL